MINLKIKGVVWKSLLLPALYSLVLVFSGCKTHYGMVNWSDHSFVYEKQAHKGTNSDSVFVTSRLTYWPQYAETLYEKIRHPEFYQLSLGAYKSFSRQGYAFSYGGFSYAGSYRSGPYFDFEEKYRAQYGFGGSAELTTNIEVGALVLRPIGIKATVIGEFGPYIRFRKELAEELFTREWTYWDNVSTLKNFTYSFGFTQELLISREEFGLSMATFVGFTQEEILASFLHRLRLKSWTIDAGLYISYYQGGYPTVGISKRL